MRNDLLNCSVWILKSQLDGSYVPGILEPREMNKLYILLLKFIYSAHTLQLWVTERSGAEILFV